MLGTNGLCLASHPEYPKFAPLLSPGWISGRMVDNSDQQYASFRDNVPYLIVVMILHPVLRRIFDTFFPSSTKAAGSDSSSLAPEVSEVDERLNQRVTFDIGFSILFLIALHGFSALKVMAILYINYNIATRLKRSHLPVVTWVFNIGILFANELGEGYPFGRLVDTVLPWSTSLSSRTKGAPNANWGTVLDRYGGLIPRWEILFNVTVLRLISFNFDHYWSLNQAGGSPIEVCQYRSTET